MVYGTLLSVTWRHSDRYSSLSSVMMRGFSCQPGTGSPHNTEGEPIPGYSVTTDEGQYFTDELCYIDSANDN